METTAEGTDALALQTKGIKVSQHQGPLLSGSEISRLEQLVSLTPLDAVAGEQNILHRPLPPVIAEKGKLFNKLERHHKGV